MSVSNERDDETPGAADPDPREMDPDALPGHEELDSGTIVESFGTASVPSYRSFKSDEYKVKVRGRSIEPLEPGRHLGGFEVVKVLGKGAFGVVYLARERGLDRQVALKVSANEGDEARTMASLEHDHIVRVFSESVIADPDVSPDDLRLFCMQYVPGTTLREVLKQLQEREADVANLDGARVLDLIDELATAPTRLDASALRDRQLLAGSNYFEVIAWIGARLAEALAFAHGQGVLHRDIKPANILVNPYGRPFLADFSLSFRPPEERRSGAEGSQNFGGTLAYMAPEHLDAFDSKSDVSSEVVDERSDLYSLGLVLYQLLALDSPFPISAERFQEEGLAYLAEQRRNGPRSLRTIHPTISVTLDRIVCRCLDPDPAERFQTADELAQELVGANELERIRRDLPPAGPFVRAATKHPILALVVLGLLPHLLGSAVNISYNSLRIVGELSTSQQATFAQLVLYYNAVVYPLSLLVGIWFLLPLLRSGRRFLTGRSTDRDSVDAARQASVSLPLRFAQLACLGWFPGIAFFPLGLRVLSGPLPMDVYVHFFVSFALSGMIALTYSYLAVQFVTLRIFYPRLWPEVRQLRERAARELSRVGARLRIFQLLAGSIPLVGAVLVVLVGPEEFVAADGKTSAVYDAFRYLVVGLIAMGCVGFQLAVGVSRVLTQTLHAFAGARSGA